MSNSLELLNEVKPNRQAIVRITPELILSMLMTGNQHSFDRPASGEFDGVAKRQTATITKGVPADAQVIGCHYDIQNGNFYIRFESKSDEIPVVATGTCAAELQILGEFTTVPVVKIFTKTDGILTLEKSPPDPPFVYPSGFRVGDEVFLVAPMCGYNAHINLPAGARGVVAESPNRDGWPKDAVQVRFSADDCQGEGAVHAGCLAIAKATEPPKTEKRGYEFI